MVLTRIYRHIAPIYNHSINLSIESSRNMNFFEKFFGRGQNKPEQTIGCFNWLCANKKDKESYDFPCEPKTSSMLNSRTISMSSRPTSLIKGGVTAQKLETSVIQINSSIVQSQAELISEEDLIGVVVTGHRGIKVLKTDCSVIKIGKDEEIQQIRSLRSFSVTKLIVFFNEFGCDFEISDLISAKQHLIIVLEGQSNLKSILTLWEEALLSQFGELSFAKSLQRLDCQIKKLEGKFWIHFENIITDKKMNQILDCLKLVDPSLPISQNLVPLVEKITLNQFLGMRKQPFKIGYKQLLSGYLKEISEEIQKQKQVIIKIQAQCTTADTIPDNKEIDEPLEEINESKSSNFEIYAQYYLQRQNFQNQKDQQQLNAYQFDPIQEIFFRSSQNEEQPDPNTQTTYSQAFRNRKNRSKSQDAKYLQDECIDDELFDKY